MEAEALVPPHHLPCCLRPPTPKVRLGVEAAEWEEVMAQTGWQEEGSNLGSITYKHCNLGKMLHLSASPPISSPRSHHWSHLPRQLGRLGHLLTVKCCQGFHLPQPQSAIHLKCTKWCPSLHSLWEGAVGKSMPVTSAVVHPPWHPIWRSDGTSKQLYRMRNQERRCQTQGLFPWYQEGQAMSYAKDQG